METRPLGQFISKPEPAVQFEEVTERSNLRLEPRLETVFEREPALAEQFRTLAAKLRSLKGAHGICCLGVASASTGEGKTTITTALAMVMAQEPGRRVLLIDADLRKPDVERYLGLERRQGLADWLEHPEETVLLRRLGEQEFFLLGAGQRSDRPWELIGSAWLPALTEAARRRFDFVLVDCPPLMPVADSALIQDCLDGFLLVVRARTVPRETVLVALDRLKKEKILGLVFNDCRGMISRYYHYGYYPKEP